MRRASVALAAVVLALLAPASGPARGAAVCKPTPNDAAGPFGRGWQAGRNGRYGPAGSATVITDRFGRFRFEGPVPGLDFGSAHIHIRVTAPPYKTLVARYVLAPGERRGTVRLVLEPDLL